jgi:predicted enzyme related to lactoylglutathione lyase
VTRYPPGTPCWVDLGTPEPDRSAEFYSRLFRWTVDDPDLNGYRLCRLDGQLVAAFGPGEDPGRPYWTTNISVVDVEPTADAIVAAGGDIVTAPTDAGEFGRFAVAIDTVGAPISLWQPRAHLGAELRSVPGAWAHTHLFTDDADRAAAFYRNVFGWSRAGTRWNLDGQAAASFGPATTRWRPPRRSLWLIVFEVDDVAVAATSVAGLGGVVYESINLPCGPIAVVADDQEAAFGLWQRA